MMDGRAAVSPLLPPNRLLSVTTPGVPANSYFGVCHLQPQLGAEQALEAGRVKSWIIPSTSPTCSIDPANVRRKRG